jgi:hypothetical protein
MIGPTVKGKQLDAGRPIVVVFLVFSAGANGFGFFDAVDKGDPLVCVTPASISMGGLWALPSGGAASIFLNPAELSLERTRQLVASTGYVSWNSTTEYLQGLDHRESGTIPLTATGAYSFQVGEVSAGIGFCRVSDFSFDGCNLIPAEETSGRLYIYAVQHLDSRGSLWETTAGLSTGISDWLLVGVSSGLRSGSGHYTLEYVVPSSPAADTTYTCDWRETAFCAHAGILFPFEFGTFGASWVSGSDMYPSRIAGGFVKPMSIFGGGSLGVEFDVLDPEDASEQSGRFFGIFPGMIEGVTTRYGIGFWKAHLSHRSGLCFSTGSTVELSDRFSLDLAVSWRSRSRSGTSFPDVPYMTIHDDNATFFGAGVSAKL